MGHRLFVAIPVPPAIRKEAAIWRKTKMTLPVRWLSEKSLHITVLPPFETDDAGVSEAAQKMRSFCRYSRFEITFNRVTLGPTASSPRLVWATGEAPGTFKKIVKKAAEAFGKRLKSQDALLHITLARFRPESFPDFLEKNLNEKVGWRAAAESIALVESHLNPAGAEYDVIFLAPLQNKTVQK